MIVSGEPLPILNISSISPATIFAYVVAALVGIMVVSIVCILNSWRKRGMKNIIPIKLTPKSLRHSGRTIV